MLILARSILVGWTMLFALAYAVEHPLLSWTARLLGASWFVTIRIILDCMGLAAVGWVIGRFHRGAPVLGVLAFAATLSFRDLDPLVAVNVPWLVRLTKDTLRDSLYLESLMATVVQHVLLFGSLIVGALLSRPRPMPISIRPTLD